jgi:hypothetical protein
MLWICTHVRITSHVVQRVPGFYHPLAHATALLICPGPVARPTTCCTDALHRTCTHLSHSQHLHPVLLDKRMPHNHAGYDVVAETTFN